MSTSLRIGLLIASIIALLFVVVNIFNKKLNIRYSIIWFLWCLFSLLMAAFPKPFYNLSKLVGIELPVNAVFLVMIGLLYGLCFYLYMALSKHNEEIIQLTYEIAELKKEVERLQNKNEK